MKVSLLDFDKIKQIDFSNNKSEQLLDFIRESVTDDSFKYLMYVNNSIPTRLKRGIKPGNQLFKMSRLESIKFGIFRIFSGKSTAAASAAKMLYLIGVLSGLLYLTKGKGKMSTKKGSSDTTLYKISLKGKKSMELKYNKKTKKFDKDDAYKLYELFDELDAQKRFNAAEMDTLPSIPELF